MKVKKLIQKLQKLDQDLEVVLSSDPEGNSFDTLTDVDYDKNNLFDTENREFVDAVDLDEEQKLRCIKAVILWP